MPRQLVHKAAAPPIVTEERPNAERDSRERRASARRNFQVPVTACSMAETGTLTRSAVLRDASKEGVGLSAPREYPVGTAILIWREWRSPEHSIIATVVHTRREPNGWFHGCRRLDAPHS
jgi:hypothetical protein